MTRLCSDGTMGNGFELTGNRLTLDIGKKSFTIEVVRQWHRFLREVVDDPFLKVFRARLDGTLSNLSLPKAGL